MKLEKAIEILDLNIRQRNHRMPPDVFDALKLGKEALKRIQQYRQTSSYLSFMNLPGED